MGRELKEARQQLDSWHVSRYPKAKAALLRKPVRGWIRALRYALGMSGRQLAARLGISKNSVSAIEKREQDGSVTIRMMMRVGEAMDCTFFYGFLPNGTFDSIVDRQAEKVARSRIARIDRTMLLEGQQLPAGEVRRIIAREAKRLAEETPRSLWNFIDEGQGRKWK